MILAIELTILIELCFIPFVFVLFIVRCDTRSAYLHMAQSSNSEPEVGTGIPPFWPKNRINPPVEWTQWLEHFFLTSDLKEKCNTRVLLTAPDPVVEEPQPKPETPSNSETAEERISGTPTQRRR